MAGTDGGRGSGPIQGPQGRGSNSGGRPGRGANSPRVAPLVGRLDGGSTGREEVAPVIGKPNQKASPILKEKS